MNQKPCLRFPIRLLGVFVVMLALVASASAEWKEKVLYSFQNGTTDGQFLPVGGVVFDKAGNLYGATAYGGGDCAGDGCGSVFQLRPPTKKGDPWTETVLHAFLGGSGDGAEPIGGLVMDGSGNLYGTTWEGGIGSCDLGCGVVYEMKPPQTKGGDWTETVLYRFQGNNDGEAPNDDLMLASDGNLYGATQYGGGYGSCSDQGFNLSYCGTIFKLSPPKSKGGSWTERVLYSFKGDTDGATPHGDLVLGRDGAIYGTTLLGGGAAGRGTVFELRPPKKKGGAWTEKILHSFTGGKDGGWPGAGVIFDAKGSLYGGADFGGNGAGGVIFRMSTTNDGRWKESILHLFPGSGDDYYDPTVSLFDKSGNLYGTTEAGPGNLIGSVFRLEPPGQQGHWTYSMLHGFAGAPDGKLPNPPLTFDKSGDLYGTTEYGGTGTTNCPGGGCGSVFEVKQ